MDQQVVDAAIAVLATHGWEGLTLDRVATAAGIGRTTLWRQGVTKESLVETLLRQLSESYQTKMWPVLVSEGTGKERLQRALYALCDVAEENLALLSATDTAFHVAVSSEVVTQTTFTQPIERLVRDGIGDGSLRYAGSSQAIASVLFNLVCWTYVHLRRRHNWPPDTAKTQLLELALYGVAAPAAI